MDIRVRSRLAVCALLAAVSACMAPVPQHGARTNTIVVPAQRSIEEQAAQAESASRPGPEHTALDVLVGTWSTTTVAVAADGSESEPRHGNALIEWVFGGRYLRWEATLELGGVVHATTGFLGYDRSGSEYQMLMISDLATGMSVARGRGDLSGSGIRLVIELVEPATGGINRAESTLRATTADHFQLDQLGLDEHTGEERVVRRTHYRRTGASTLKK
jgi:hypothetical protein